MGDKEPAPGVGRRICLSQAGGTESRYASASGSRGWPEMI